MPSAPPLSSSTIGSPYGRLLPYLALLCVVGLTILIYWPGTRGGFLLDDYANIVGNHAVHLHALTLPNLLGAAFSSHSGPLGRPLSMASFALNEYLWGPAPYSMKVVNIAIHGLNGLLVYAVSALTLTGYRRRWRPELSATIVRWCAIATAAAWLLLPINLTSVLYVVQRMTSLSGTFVLAGVALYLCGRLRMIEGHGGFGLLWTAVVVFGGLAVLSKEAGALLPLYLFVIEATLFRFAGRDGARDRRLYLFYAVTLLLPAIAGLAWQLPHLPGLFAPNSRPFTLAQRLLTEPRVVINYIAWSLVPSLNTLSLYHDDFPLSTSLLKPPTTVLAMAAIIGLLAFAYRQRRRRPLLSLGIFWFFAGQLLTATIFNLELVFEHRNYLPTLGLLLALFSLLLLEPPLRLMKMRGAFVVGLIALYALLTLFRVETWANPTSFSVIEAAEHPNSPRATYGLGRTYLQFTKSPKSPFFPLAVKALEHAMRVPGADILPEQGLLWLYGKFHKPIPSAWWHSAERKLADSSLSAQDKNALASLVDCQLQGECRFQRSRMTKLLDTALSHNRNNPDVITIVANYTLNILDEQQEARRLIRLAIEKAPRKAQYRVNLIKLDIALGHFAAATREIASLQQLNWLGGLDDTIAHLRTRFSNAKARSRNTSPAATDGASVR